MFRKLKCFWKWLNLPVVNPMVTLKKKGFGTHRMSTWSFWTHTASLQMGLVLIKRPIVERTVATLDLRGIVLWQPRAVLACTSHTASESSLSLLPGASQEPPDLPVLLPVAGKNKMSWVSRQIEDKSVTFRGGQGRKKPEEPQFLEWALCWSLVNFSGLKRAA